MVGISRVDRHCQGSVEKQSYIGVEPRPAEIAGTKEASIGAGIMGVSDGRAAQCQHCERQHADGDTDHSTSAFKRIAKNHRRLFAT
jgi:hypothetical protein